MQQIHSSSLEFTLYFILVFLRTSSRMTLLALTFSLIKKKGSILIKAEISQGEYGKTQDYAQTQRHSSKCYGQPVMT